jgi:hypothetical protein
MEKECFARNTMMNSLDKMYEEQIHPNATVHPSSAEHTNFGTQTTEKLTAVKKVRR